MNVRYLTWKHWRDSDFGTYSPDISLYFKLELQLSGITRIDGIRVGELGFGNGAFAGWIRDQHAHWMGIEVIQALLDRAKSRGFEAVFFDSTFTKELGCASLDVIIALDVLEHLSLEQIRDFLSDAWAALNSRGKLIVRLPCGDSPFVGSIYHGDLSHRTLLGSGAIGLLAHEANFRVLQIRAPAFPLAGFPLRRTVSRVIVYFIQNCISWFLKNIIIGNKQAVISPNMVVVLEKSTQPPL